MLRGGTLQQVMVSSASLTAAVTSKQQGVLPTSHAHEEEEVKKIGLTNSEGKTSDANGIDPNRPNLFLESNQTPNFTINLTSSPLFSQLPNMPKVEIPLFDGTNPCAWIRRYNKYFLVTGRTKDRGCFISSRWHSRHLVRRMVDISGKAWMEFFHNGTLSKIWECFTKNFVEEFNKITHTRTVIEYKKRLE